MQPVVDSPAAILPMQCYAPLILSGDYLIKLKEIQSNSIDAVITDPPYSSGGFGEAQRIQAKGQGLRSETIDEIGWFPSDNMTTAGMKYLIREVCLEFDRVMKPDTSLLMFTDWRMLVNLIPVIESCGFQFRNLIVWDKGSPGLGNGFKPTHEMIMHFVKGNAKFYSLSGSNIIRANRTSPAKRLHQTQKPVELLKKLIEVVTKEGDVILDPFFGSGSVGEAAIKLGRSVVGIEKSTIHYNVATKRIKSVIEHEQRSLFNGA